MQYGSNEERYDLYSDMFTDLLRGHHDGDARVETVRANLMIDIRWPEVSRALADVVCRLCGYHCYTMRPLAHDVGRLMARAATIAFGSSRHPEIPSWFLQNNECLLAATLHKMLVEFVTSNDFVVQYTDAMMHKAFCALLDIAEGMRNYVGLAYIAESTGAHALMSAVTNSKYDFLSKDSRFLHRSERIFASVMAERIMADPNRAMELRSGFCFFARSSRWHAFARACHSACASAYADSIAPLTRLLREANDAVKCKADTTPGLFFLASEFLEADASPERAPEVARSSNLRAERRSPIAKRSQPFLRLVKRLVSGAR